MGKPSQYTLATYRLKFYRPTWAHLRRLNRMARKLKRLASA
jgi:hypothetical protein